MHARKGLNERIRVNPRDENVRRTLSHPSVGGFRESGSIEWPLDNFTKRRIRDGSVTREEEADKEQRRQQREQERNGQSERERGGRREREAAPKSE